MGFFLSRPDSLTLRLATTANFTSLLAPPTSESFGEKGESDIELNKYWQYYYDNSCMGIKNSLTIQSPNAATTASSRGNVFVTESA